MPDYSDEDATDKEVREHMLHVGLVCTQWAYLEWLLEVTHWWLIGLPAKEGRVITSGLSIETMSRRVCDLCHLRISDNSDRARLSETSARIKAVLEERNLAVHGVRKWDPDEGSTVVHIARGKYKNKPQNLPVIRLSTLNREIALIISLLEPILVRYGVIEGMTEFSAQRANK